MADMLKSTGAMAGATLASRVLGMVREICYARFMGDGLVAGAFVLAFMIPNLFRRLLGEGAYAKVVLARLRAKPDQEFAVKVMEKRFIARENKVRLVMQERRILSRVNHPNVVQLFYSYAGKHTV